MGKRTVITLLIVLIAIVAISLYFARDGSVGTPSEPQNATTTEGAVSPVPSASARALVESYVRTRISELSPEPEVLGGRFYVTKIEFAGNESGVVEYEDGHNAYRARFTYKLDPAMNVSIPTFIIEEENPPPASATSSASFSKPGNIVQNDAQSWAFVYEEPGKPALRSKLSFTGESTCNTAFGTTTCEGIVWKAGERVRVEGRMEGNTIIVFRITKL